MVDPKSYSPTRHLLTNFGLLLSLITLAWYHSRFVRWESPGLVIIFFFGFLLFGNFAVYCIHRGPLHHRFGFWVYPYKTHAIEHHSTFTFDKPSFHSLAQLNGVLFPPTVVVLFSLVAMPLLGWGVYSFCEKLEIINAHSWSWLVIGFSAFYFFLYEVLHSISHLPEDSVVLRFPYFRYMWSHHRLHHNPKLMQNTNFGIVFPFMDWIFRTKR